MKFEYVMPMDRLTPYKAEIDFSSLIEDEDPVDGSIEQPTLSEFLSLNRQEGKLLISHLTFK